MREMIEQLKIETQNLRADIFQLNREIDSMKYQIKLMKHLKNKNKRVKDPK